MEDYYRVRFKRMRPGRASNSWDTVYGKKRPPMPRLLRWVYGVSCVLAGGGWVGAMILSLVLFDLRGIWVGVLFIISMPFSIAFALGFTEDERWTRPLMVLVPAVPALLLYSAGEYWTAGLMLIVSAGLVTYLYRSPSVRAYYAFLHETRMVRYTFEDLTSPYFYALYLCVSGALLGGWLGHTIMAWWYGYGSGFDPHELYEVIGVGFVCAVSLGWLGWWLGEVLLERRLRLDQEDSQCDRNGAAE